MFIINIILTGHCINAFGYVENMWYICIMNLIIKRFNKHSFEKKVVIYKLALENECYEFLYCIHKFLNKEELNKILKVC